MSALPPLPPRQRPQAFRLDDPNVHTGPHPAQTAVHIEPQPDPFPETTLPPDERAIEQAQQRLLEKKPLLSWGAVFWSALGGLLSLAIGLWITQVIDGLFARFAALGWLGLGLVGCACLALVALALREFLAIHRQKNIAKLHIAFAKAAAADDAQAARTLLPALLALYAARPEMAAAKARVRGLASEIIDGRDLIGIFEHELIGPLDINVQQQIADASKRVSLVTAIAPRAFLDVIFVAAQIIRLIRSIAEIYGSKPGFFGLIRLGKSIALHLAITGGMAAGDSVLQQIVGHGLAARLSAKLGEGVLNGILTARVGLSAMALCRPLPFLHRPAPGLKQVAPSLFSKPR